MKQVLRCAIYTRKSTDEGLEQDFNSLHAQREACEAYIASQRHEGWVLHKTHYDDGGFSGGNMQRPALQQLMEDIAAHKINIVVVYKVDRLTRSLSDFAKIVEHFDAQGVSFVSVTQQFNTTTSIGRLTLNVLLSFAQFEREVTGERIRDKIAASKKKGMWMGGVLPLGYDVKDRKLMINASEAKTVQFMYRSYLELGSVRQLQEEMVRKNLRSKTGTQPTRQGGNFMMRGAIYKLLSNPIYIGQIRHKDICYTGQHEAIIDQELWNQVQNHLAANAVEHKTRSTTAYPLTGKLFDVSGEQLKPRNVKKHGRRYRYYVSESLLTNTKEQASSGWRLPAGEIEKAIAKAAQETLKDRQIVINALRANSIPAHRITQMIDTASKLEPEKIWDYIKRIELQENGIKLTITLASEVELAREIPMQMKRRGVEMRLVVDNAAPANIDQTLIKNIAQAHRWLRELESGKGVTEIAMKEGIDRSDVTKRLSLAFLAPDIVEAIVAGKQPVDLTTEKLVKRTDLPLEWGEQRRLLGFD